jgi:hypothetical protein
MLLMVARLLKFRLTAGLRRPDSRVHVPSRSGVNGL